ncbi:ATP-binding protein [Ancylobacter sp. A5.8]|uniref:AAA family ATPase n=1 Tax=Ancylobacter gelatini TaxID=2919920 RepID=UPI001F4DAEB5|nr:ATP-binding protein [Ancylobacter gelatini]MCJ8142932.1 ATP-binding protein [Ancylobacter gelatini]
MRNVFVETENVGRFNGALKVLERRGAAESCLMVVDGLPGLGKTTALHRWAAQNQALFLRAKREWDAGWFIDDLLAQLNVAKRHSFKDRFRQATEALATRQSDFAIQKRTFALVIDEADHFSRSQRIMETIRDLSDSMDLITILVGMGRIRHNLTAFPQISSRVGQRVEFAPASRDDVVKLIAELSDVPVADDLAGFVQQVSGGFTREIKESITLIERFGKRNGYGADNPLPLGAMRGQVIGTNRANGHAVIVPEGV